MRLVSCTKIDPICTACEVLLPSPYMKSHYVKLYLSALSERCMEGPDSNHDLKRDCQAICDIRVEDPYGHLSDVGICFNDVYFAATREEPGLGSMCFHTGWNTRWFTEENMLPVHLLPYAYDFLAMEFKEDCSPSEMQYEYVRVTWKKFSYESETCERLLSLASTAPDYLPISYDGRLRLQFRWGTVFPGFTCGKVQITSAGIKDLSVQDQDWYCKSIECSELNFAKHAVCSKCGLPRE